MRYTRTSVRGLGDGAAIRVSRSYAVGFAPQENSYPLGGKQIAVDGDSRSTQEDWTLSPL